GKRSGPAGSVGSSAHLIGGAVARDDARAVVRRRRVVVEAQHAVVGGVLPLRRRALDPHDGREARRCREPAGGKCSGKLIPKGKGPIGCLCCPNTASKAE